MKKIVILTILLTGTMAVWSQTTAVSEGQLYTVTIVALPQNGYSSVVRNETDFTRVGDIPVWINELFVDLGYEIAPV